MKPSRRRFFLGSLATLFGLLGFKGKAKRNPEVRKTGLEKAYFSNRGNHCPTDVIFLYDAHGRLVGKKNHG